MTHESAKLWNNSDHGTAKQKRRQAECIADVKTRRDPAETAFDAACAKHGLPYPEYKFIFAPWEGGLPGCFHFRGGFNCERCGANRRPWRFAYLFEGWLGVWECPMSAEARNDAVAAGYAVLEFTPSQFADESAFAVIKRVLGAGEANQP